MSKGGGGETTSTVYQNSLPEYVQPYMEDILSRGQALSNQPYQPYGGQRLADQTAQTTAGLNMGQQFAESGMPMLGNANSLANMVGQQAMDLQNYQAGGVNNTYTGPAAWQNGQFSADQVGFGQGGFNQLTSDTFGADDAQRYMSPYMSAVTASAQADAQRKALQEQAYIKAQQGKSGSFGGSRGAVQQQIALNEAQQRISDIGVQGRQSAFENAQQQYERDQARSMQAQTGNQSSALQALLANQAKNLEAQGMGEQSRQFGYSAGEAGRQKASELGMYGQEATEKLRQGGKQLGLEGLKLGSTTAGQLANFQGMSDSMRLQRMQAMLGTGQAIEDRSQQGLDLAYEDFMRQQNWPRENLQLISQLAHGMPTGMNQTVQQTTPSNPMAGIAGTYMGMQALQRLGNMNYGTGGTQATA